MRLLALAGALLIAATFVPLSADAGPVRSTARGTATAVAVTGKTAAKGTVVVPGPRSEAPPPPVVGSRAAPSASRPSSAAAAVLSLAFAETPARHHNLATATICRGMLAVMSCLATRPRLCASLPSTRRAR